MKPPINHGTMLFTGCDMRLLKAYWVNGFETIAILVFLFVVGCAPAPPVQNHQIRETVIGKTKDAIVLCAGQPVQEVATKEGVVLRYYIEAPMFEESAVFLKSSRPGIHHGCWANLLIDKDLIVGAEYKAVPESFEDVSLCDRLFQSCEP
jgi:hypothetical protein